MLKGVTVMFVVMDTIEEVPMDLLLLADPSYQRVKAYLNSGICVVYKEDDGIVGSYILVALDTERIELVNIAVKDSKQGVGIGKSYLIMQ